MSRNSDRRKLKDVRNVTGALEKVDALQTVAYKHVDEDPNKPESIGWIAQDFAKVFPQLIRKREIDDGEGPIKDPVFEKPKPNKPGRDPGIPPGAGNPGQGQGQGRGPDDPELEPEPEQPEIPFEPDPVSEPIGGFTITSYEAIIPILTQAIKELHAKVKELEAKAKK